MRLSPDATFDCLFVAARLQKQNGTFTAPEIHLLTYLACLLWIYRRRMVTDWGYSFVGTELGAPFSLDVDISTKNLLERGYFLRLRDRLRTTELAERLLREFGELALNQQRKECLDAACAGTAMFPIGMIGTALSQEPELKRAHALPTSRRLLDESAQSRLYSQFDSLYQALSGRSSDLRLPAVVWLSALYQSTDYAATEA